MIWPVAHLKYQMVSRRTVSMLIIDAILFAWAYLMVYLAFQRASPPYNPNTIPIQQDVIPSRGAELLPVCGKTEASVRSTRVPYRSRTFADGMRPTASVG